ncbi:ion channel [Bombella mellum]|uniref:ATP-sensitive potassium channel protein n=1 Tax=Bombella mellum TaxID=2039288 RepID=A0ABR5ZQQ6_9PROT|nr:ion channel [Bombella mellum]MBA5726663.1 ATP-sensitive potassium channel protein [Bombella mellum]
MHLQLPESLLNRVRHQQSEIRKTSVLSQDNTINIITRKRAQVRFLADLYHTCLTMGWGAFFASVTCFYLFLNILFSIAYFLVPHGLSNVKAGEFWGDFFFSAQTLSTVGYGYIYPQSHLANAIASLEMLTSVIFTAIITGIVFARFARPHAQVLFSNVATLFQDGDHLRLNFRVGNLRRTPLMNASIEAILARTKKDINGNSSLQLDILPLSFNHVPVFPVSLSFAHHILETSPLHGMDTATLEEQQATIFLVLTATDPVSAQDVFAQHTYRARDLLFGARFVSLLKPSSQGVLEVDFSLFHTTSTDPLPARDEEPVEVKDDTAPRA